MRDKKACHLRMLAVAVTSTVLEHFKCLTTALARTMERSSVALDMFAITHWLA